MPVLLIINSPRRKSGWIPKVREIKAKVGKKLIGKKNKVDWKPLGTNLWTMQISWGFNPFLKEQAEV